MHKINTSTATSDNRFTDGDFAIGIPPTQLSAAWFNAVQGELTNLVEGWNGTIGEADKEGGNYVLSQTSNNQILKIIHEKLSDLRTELQNQITTNAANIATNTANIATNTTNIATNTANIATNTANIATNTAHVSGLVGTIIYAATTDNVPGYLKLNGAKYGVADYPELARWAFDNSGKTISDYAFHLDRPDLYRTTFLYRKSIFERNTYFRLPNFRGLFLRVLDEGGGVDVDGRRRDILSEQNHADQRVMGFFNPSGSYGLIVNGNTGPFRAENVNRNYAESGDNRYGGRIEFDNSRVVSTSQNETRPKNVSVCAYIKY